MIRLNVCVLFMFMLVSTGQLYNTNTAVAKHNLSAIMPIRTMEAVGNSRDSNSSNISSNNSEELVYNREARFSKASSR